MNDFKSCFLFYRDTMELPVRYGDENDVYAEFKTGAIHIALFKKNLMADVVATSDKHNDVDAQDNTAIILRVEDVDKTYHHLMKKGVFFETKPQDRKEWECRTAHFRDPDGNLFELNSDLFKQLKPRS